MSSQSHPSPPFDYYELLGVHQRATQDQIDEAYGMNLWLWNKSGLRNPNTPEAREALGNLHTAYVMLSNRKTRALYDLHGSALRSEPEIFRASPPTP